MNLLSAFIIDDLNSEKLAIITDRRCQNILSLAKFSQENELIEFVFKYNWPLILTELARISMDEPKVNLFLKPRNKTTNSKKASNI
jgi:hypothetical protein